MKQNKNPAQTLNVLQTTMPLKSCPKKRKWLSHKTLVVKPFLASPIGFEPTACRLGGDRSILLSYGDKYSIGDS